MYNRLHLSLHLSVSQVPIAALTRKTHTQHTALSPLRLGRQSRTQQILIALRLLKLRMTGTEHRLILFYCGYDRLLLLLRRLLLLLRRSRVAGQALEG